MAPLSKSREARRGGFPESAGVSQLLAQDDPPPRRAAGDSTPAQTSSRVARSRSPMTISDQQVRPPAPAPMDWAEQITEQGTGQVIRLASGFRLVRHEATTRAYSNAQIGDAAGGFSRRPPLTLTVRAHFSHPLARLRGTAGFGFWNAALGPSIRGIRPPRAAWFFL